MLMGFCILKPKMCVKFQWGNTSKYSHILHSQKDQLCMHQTRPTRGTKHSAFWYEHSWGSPCLPWDRASCRWTSSMRCSKISEWDILLQLFQQMSTAMTHVANDISSFSRTNFVCLLANQHTSLKWKDAISMLTVLQGSAETPIRRGKKWHETVSQYAYIPVKNSKNPTTHFRVSLKTAGIFLWDTAWVHFVWPDPIQPIRWLTQPNPTQY